MIKNSVPRWPSNSVLNKENLVELSNRYHNKSVNNGLRSEFSSSLRKKTESELPDFKNRLKQSDLMKSYISESWELKKRKSVLNNSENVINLKLNQKLSRRLNIIQNISQNEQTSNAQINEYGYQSSNENKSPHKIRKISLSTQKVKEFLSGKDLKFVTPNNITQKLNLERESEGTSTKESNQFQSMKKISKSIDRLKAKAKLLGINHLSAPTENRVDSIGLKELDMLDKYEIPTTPKLSVSK